MKIGKFKIRRKALSPVIATLLMVAIAVAAAIITYVWAMGLLGGLMGTGGAQTKEQLILENYNWKDPAGKLAFVLRNVGSSKVTVAAGYLEGIALTGVGGATESIDVGGTKSYTDIGQPVGFTGTDGASYVLKIVTASGATFTYSIVKGKAG
jgi:flagellin-like protein